MTPQELSLSPGVYILKNASTGTVLDLYYGNPGENIAITGYQPHGGDNQKVRYRSSGTCHS
jgi:hypothetical protein